MSLRIIEWEDFLKDDASSGPCSASFCGTAMTIGVFDGLHMGHRELIGSIVRQGPNPTIVTFRENPKKLVSPETFEGDIFSLKQKLAIFEQLGVRQVILIDFSENFSKLTGKEFLDFLENRGKMTFLAIGDNFRCGYQTDTDADTIAEINRRKGIPTEVVSPVIMPVAFGTGPVSSSKVRSAIISGDLKTAAALMSRNFQLDLSDIEPAAIFRGNANGLAYDPFPVRRIVPAAGRYTVLLYPGGIKCSADVEDGEIFLGGLRSTARIESLEFIAD